MIVDKEILKQVIKKWGFQAQVDMAIEEMAELTNALIKWRRGRVDGDAVVEEIADVLMMAQQMRFIFGSEKVDAMIQKKTERLMGRIADPERSVL